ncbi:MAG: hypothetical protein JNK81_10100 [Anaerolineales bacterium]|nr:hypothetical protein [Anaerolineales bacterium]
MTKSISFFVLIVLSILLTACGGSATEGAVSYIGTIDGAPESARIGVVAENGKFVIYICSLDDAFNLATSRWFSGDLDGDGTFVGTSPDGVKVNGSVNGSSLIGFITTLQGERLTFRGSAIPAGGPAGIYQGIGEYDGQQVIVGAVIDEDNLFAAATVQVSNTVEFITPVVTPPFRVNNTELILTFGDLGQKVDLLLVSTVEGVE